MFLVFVLFCFCHIYWKSYTIGLMEAVTQKCCRGTPTLRVIWCWCKNCQNFCDLFSLKFSHHCLPFLSALLDFIIIFFLCHLNAQKKEIQNNHLLDTVLLVSKLLIFSDCIINLMFSRLFSNSVIYIILCIVAYRFYGRFSFKSHARKIQIGQNSWPGRVCDQNIHPMKRYWSDICVQELSLLIWAVNCEVGFPVAWRTMQKCECACDSYPQFALSHSPLHSLLYIIQQKMNWKYKWNNREQMWLDCSSRVSLVQFHGTEMNNKAKLERKWLCKKTKGVSNAIIAQGRAKEQMNSWKILI